MTVMMIFMCSFFDRQDTSHFIVYYTGHGKSKGWQLPDGSNVTLEQILEIWSRRRAVQDQKLLLANL